MARSNGSKVWHLRSESLPFFFTFTFVPGAYGALIYWISHVFVNHHVILDADIRGKVFFRSLFFFS